MGLQFATQNPSEKELLKLILMLSTFRDGSGNEKELDGSTRAGWREIERCIAEQLNGLGGENKNIFDVIAPDETNNKIYYGFSVKSKQLSLSKFNSLSSTGRVYMEIANSLAKFWDRISQKHGLTQADFCAMKFPQEIGTAVIELVKEWHQEGKNQFELLNPGMILNLENSCYLCVSYSKDDPGKKRYQIHSFSLEYPSNLKWQYISDKCLRAYDPRFKNEVILDWYGGPSGGQLKYYPRASSARYKTKDFRLIQPPKILKILDKAKIYFPEYFIKNPENK